MKSYDQHFFDYFESKFSEQDTDLESLLETLELQISLVERAAQAAPGVRISAIRDIEEARALLRRISEALGRTQESAC